jgi:hypothetical protein
MTRAAALALVVLLAGAPALAQVPPLPPSPGAIVGPILDENTPTVLRPAENETGQDLHSEEIRIDVLVDVVNVEYEIVNIMFGGGKVGADATVNVHLEFRAVSTVRLDEALRATSGDANVTLYSTFGVPTNRTAITAEEIRVIGGGALLAAFQTYQAEETKRFVETTLPGLTLLSANIDWSNTAPAGYLTGYRPPDALPDSPESLLDAAPQPDLREPPLVLDANARLGFISRVSLGEIVGDAIQKKARGEDETETPAERLKKSLQENETAGILDRTAFNVMGLTQLLALGVPPGWLLNLTMLVPAGYTVEGATDELIVDGSHRNVVYVLDGAGRATASDQAGLVTLSNRYLVTVTALVVVALLGAVIGLPLEIAALSATAANYKRQTGMTFPRRPSRLARWLKAVRRRA